jgi:ATP-binding cassette, sub-family E, member 1
LEDNLKSVTKPQYVEQVAKAASKLPEQTVGAILKRQSQMDNLEVVMEELELLHLADREVSKLSGGELQRFAIASVCVTQSDVYMFDEPSSFLVKLPRFYINFLGD